MRSMFTPDARAQVIATLRAGLTTEQACETAGVARSTFQGWMRKGARADGGEYCQFRGDVEAARARPLREAPVGPLTESVLVAMLEQKAREGSIRAIELLLRRPWARRGAGTPMRDEFSWVDELASRRRTREPGTS